MTIFNSRLSFNSWRHQVNPGGLATQFVIVSSYPLLQYLFLTLVLWYFCSVSSFVSLLVLSTYPFLLFLCLL